jgi:hypothetical protein
MSNACFVGARTVVLTSACGSVEALYAVDTVAGTVRRLLADGPHALSSCAVLDVARDPADASTSTVLLVVSSPAARPRLCVLSVQEKEEGGLAVGELVECVESAHLAVAPSRRKVLAATAPSDESSPSPAPPKPPADGTSGGDAAIKREAFTRCPLPPPVGTGGDPITWKLNYYKDANGIPYESILMVPTAAAGADATPLPLIVVPHGGPHSVTPTSYIASYAYLCLYLGAAVLQVDYMRA